MKPSLVLSQLPDRFNAMLAATAPEALIRPWRAPIEALPREAEILLPMPFVRGGEAPPASPPPGWPFGLRWVQLFSAGLDYYPRWLFDGCTVTSSGGASAQSVAEFAIAAVLAAAKRLPESWIGEAADWRRQAPLGMIAGATLGVVGFGAIGRRVAAMAAALGMTVKVVRRSPAPPDLPGIACASDLPALFAGSDHVVLALSGEAHNYGIVDAELLRHAKPGLHLVNVARGRLIDDVALLAALDDRRLSRATLDVAFPEPLPPDHPFYRHPGVRLSPHIAFDTPDTDRALVEIFARNLARFRHGERLADTLRAPGSGA